MRGNALIRDGTRLYDGGNAYIVQRDSGFWRCHRSAGRLDAEPAMSLTCEMALNFGQTMKAGA
jgi:hypothetical protein